MLAGLCGALAVEARLGWTENRLRLGELVAMPVVAALSTMLNPYGPKLITETLQLSNDSARLLDREWLPLWRLGELVPAEKLALVLLGLTVLAALLFLPRRRLRLWVLLVLAVGTSVSASRHLRMAPILLAPVVAALAEAALARVKGFRLERLDALAVKLSGVLAVALLGLWAVRVPEALKFIEWNFLNPSNAIAVMRLNGLSGNVWNDFDWGGLLLWTAPDSRVACDGRHVMAYSGEMIRANIDLGHDARDPLKVLEHFKADMALLRTDDPALHRLSQRYTVLFCDQEACLLSKRPEHIALYKEGKLKLPATLMFTSEFFDSPAGPDAALR